MLRYFRMRRLEKIAIKLAGAEAALANERDMSNATGNCYPIVLSNLTREIAELRAERASLRHKVGLA